MSTSNPLIDCGQLVEHTLSSGLASTLGSKPDYLRIEGRPVNSDFTTPKSEIDSKKIRHHSVPDSSRLNSQQ